MHKTGALGRQLYPPIQSPSSFLSIKHSAIPWFSLCLLSSLLGYLFEQILQQPPRLFLESQNLKTFTGPSLYFSYFWLYYFLFKCFSSILIYTKYNSFLLTKDKSIKDLALIVSFFIELRILKYLFQHFEINISGHCLILVIGSYTLDTEGALSSKLIDSKSVLYISKFLIGLHYYFGFFTAFAFHTGIEVVLALVSGFLTIVIINKLLIR